MPKTRRALVLPEGMTYYKITGTFGTAVLSPVFRLYQEYKTNESDLVAGAGIAPATSRLCLPLRLSPPWRYLRHVRGLDYTFSLHIVGRESAV